MNSIREALLSLASGSVTHHALDSSVCGPHELHKGGLVVQPLALQALLWWVLVTTELKCDLKVIGAEVVEVLHPATHRVPGCSVGDSSLLRKFILLRVTARSAWIRHPWVVASVDR